MGSDLGIVDALHSDGREDLFEPFTRPFDVVPLKLRDRAIFTFLHVKQMCLSISVGPIVARPEIVCV